MGIRMPAGSARRERVWRSRGVGVQRDTADMQEMAVVGGQDVVGHIETHLHPPSRYRAIEMTHRQVHGEVDQIDAGGLQSVLRQVPVGSLTDLPDAQL